MRYGLICVSLLAGAAQLPAQLPPDAVDLAKVKISEQVKSVDLCPVHLVASAPDMETWTHQGVAYRGHQPGCQAAFDENPDQFVPAAAKQRWMNSFMAQMSNIWCPVTDDIAPGGMTQWVGLGYTWESCCAFCDAGFDESDLPPALERLTARAAESYQIQSGRYVEGASSPIAGAIAGMGGAVEEEPVVEASGPAYLAGVDLQPTYNGGVGLIFEQRCVECHRPAGEAPMELTNYGEIRRWTRSMKLQIGSRSMPPWPADPEVGEFANDRRLSDVEFETLIAWADAGFPSGDGSYQPKSLGEWSIGEPDHVFTIPDHTVAENVTGEFVEFKIKTDFPEDRWVVATEAKPGDPYLVFGIDGGPLGSYRPGSPVQTVPAGAGYLLMSGAEVTVRVHYADKGTGFELTDTGSQLGVIFADSSTGRQALLSDPMAAPDFSIRARASDIDVSSRFTMPADGQIWSLMPVMMWRGKSVQYEAVLPDGSRQALLSIPRWAPTQKARYWLETPLEAPQGTVIEATAHFDNSNANANNPDASATVESGPAGEIFEGWVGYTLK